MTTYFKKSNCVAMLATPPLSWICPPPLLRRWGPPTRSVEVVVAAFPFPPAPPCRPRPRRRHPPAPPSHAPPPQVLPGRAPGEGMGGLAQGPVWPGRDEAGGEACAAAQDLEQHAAQDVNAHRRGRRLGGVARGERAEGRAARGARRRGTPPPGWSAAHGCRGRSRRRAA